MEAVLLLDDLMQREGLMSGESDRVELAVLSVPQAQGESPLPEQFQMSVVTEQTNSLESDMLWEQYFRYVHRIAFSYKNRFLIKWVAFEIALRNALAATRAARLGLDEANYQIACDLAYSDEDLSLLISEWESSPTPLEGLRVIIRARWAWLDRNDSWYSFSSEELLAYAVRVMLMEQWCRTERGGEGAV